MGFWGETWQTARAVAWAMTITLKNLFRKPVTVHYPDVVRPYPAQAVGIGADDVRVVNRHGLSEEVLQGDRHRPGHGAGRLPGLPPETHPVTRHGRRSPPPRTRWP